MGDAIGPAFGAVMGTGDGVLRKKNGAENAVGAETGPVSGIRNGAAMGDVGIEIGSDVKAVGLTMRVAEGPGDGVVGIATGSVVVAIGNGSAVKENGLAAGGDDTGATTGAGTGRMTGSPEGTVGGVDCVGRVGAGGVVPVAPGVGTLNGLVSPLPNCPSLDANNKSPSDISA